MAYSKQTWVDADQSKPLSAARLNHIEDGIDAAALSTDARKYHATPTGGNDSGGLESAIAALPSTGGEIQLRSLTYSFQSLITGLAGRSNVTIRGLGPNRTILNVTPTTGDLFNLTNSSFVEVSDMTINVIAQKTAGSIFKLANGAGICQQNAFRRLLINSGYRAFDLGACTLIDIEDVQVGDINAAWTWDSIAYTSGAAISCHVNRLRGGTAAGMTNGVVRINNGATDTFHGSQWDLAAQSGANMQGLIIDGGTWSKFTDISIECGSTKDAVTINGGTETHITSPHLLGQRGAYIHGGTGTKIIGGNTITQIHGVVLDAGTDTLIQGMDIHDIGYLSGGGSGWKGIDVANGVSDFSLLDNTIGRAILGATQPVTLIQVGTSANAQGRYYVDRNRGRNYTGTPWVDNGTGTGRVFDTAAIGRNVAVP